MAVTLYGVVGGGGGDSLFPLTDAITAFTLNSDSDPNLESGSELTAEVMDSYEADFVESAPVVNIV